ncbi:MAG: hypothetical protein JW700_02645 [Candidatus Aenigmarchaeota archaeon]|nr:hypothetical protein [Candidatus Aenigmarchaeota archaeon]
MKGQFFMVATVIMIITLMALVRYFYSFSDINLTQIKEISELEYVPYIRQSLDDVIASNSGDCNKLQVDFDQTVVFLENKMIERGMVLDIDYTVNCPSAPLVTYSFEIQSPDILIEA